MEGTFVGTGDGKESGPFVARIEIARLPGGGVSIDYEAMSREHGLQHREHSLLVAGQDGKDRLHVASSESPFVTIMTESEAGSGRFDQRESLGPYAMAVEVAVPGPDWITYAWLWSRAGGTPIEQSKADARRLD